MALNIVKIINNILFNAIDEVAPKEFTICCMLSLSLSSLLIFERHIEGVSVSKRSSQQQQ